MFLFTSWMHCCWCFQVCWRKYSLCKWKPFWERRFWYFLYIWYLMFDIIWHHVKTLYNIFLWDCTLSYGFSLTFCKITYLQVMENLAMWIKQITCICFLGLYLPLKLCYFEHVRIRWVNCVSITVIILMQDWVGISSIRCSFYNWWNVASSSRMVWVFIWV